MALAQSKAHREVWTFSFSPHIHYSLSYSFSIIQYLHSSSFHHPPAIHPSSSMYSLNDPSAIHHSLPTTQLSSLLHLPFTFYVTIFYDVAIHHLTSSHSSPSHHVPATAFLLHVYSVQPIIHLSSNHPVICHLFPMHASSGHHFLVCHFQLKSPFRRKLIVTLLVFQAVRESRDIEGGWGTWLMSIKESGSVTFARELLPSYNFSTAEYSGNRTWVWILIPLLMVLWGLVR